tara:strand:- start:341 stop:535 length:195 start_codon:yes stop_codon:yes gene_type:complete
MDEYKEIIDKLMKVIDLWIEKLERERILAPDIEYAKECKEWHQNHENDEEQEEDFDWEFQDEHT